MKYNGLYILIFCLVLIVNQSCTMVKVTISEKRNPIPQEVTIGENTNSHNLGVQLK